MSDDELASLAHTALTAVLTAIVLLGLLYGFPRVTKAFFDVPRVLWTIDSCANQIPAAGV